MACVRHKVTPGDVESEMEEGEIVDELDDLSDISSEEEFLLRQRLEVLENYNNVLERKEAKRTSETPGKSTRIVQEGAGLLDLSEISASELEDEKEKSPTTIKDSKHSKCCHTFKIRRGVDIIHNKKKVHRKKKKIHLKIISESSDESDDEYRNKRRKLANAVTVHENICDKSSLKTRLNNMLHGVRIDPIIRIDKKVQDVFHIPNIETSKKQLSHSSIVELKTKTEKAAQTENIFIDLSSDDDTTKSQKTGSIDTVDSVKNSEVKTHSTSKHSSDEKNDSDEDLEMLRQHALKTKAAKTKKDQESNKNNSVFSEEEDSDTAELRMICLKSALLKRAIEIKQKQRLQKRSNKISQSSNFHDELFLDSDIGNGNNTDIESVDMDIGSDTEDKGKNIVEETTKNDKCNESKDNTNLQSSQNISVVNIHKQVELDEDEDLLRAKLLTSLSKNLPHLVEPSEINDIKSPIRPLVNPKSLAEAPEEKKFIINLGESDSEGEHEATKNLTMMHIKLSEQVDFQNKLDRFLKTTRREVEKSKLPDVVLKPDTPPKYIPKVVNHLPKSEQLEYQNLVKRMTELEKMKQVRQAAVENLKNGLPLKDKLKARNVSIENTDSHKVLEAHIAQSRKKIADESTIIMKLKQESQKLLQKLKIVATEYKNISTAIVLNKKELRNAQIRLSKIRTQHQLLLKSNPLPKTVSSPPINSRINNNLSFVNRLQKENYPTANNSELLKPFKVTVVNDFKDREPVINNNLLSVQIDVSSNKKTVKLPKSTDKDRLVNKKDSDQLRQSEQIQDIGTARKNEERLKDAPTDEKNDGNISDDYESPLQALHSARWMEDPNAILCPFEVSGNCKDPDCRYMHPKIPS